MDERKRFGLAKLITSIIVCQLAGFIGSLFTAPAIPGWYASLDKPPFTPPSAVFAPVWTALYLLMGISLYLIWRTPKETPQRRGALFLFALQLFLSLRSSAVPQYHLVHPVLWNAIAPGRLGGYRLSVGGDLGDHLSVLQDLQDRRPLPGPIPSLDQLCGRLKCLHHAAQPIKPQRIKMRPFPIPNVVISKCLGFARCRWNGAVIPDEFVESLKPLVSFYPVCPEMEIGLGVPRDPIRIVDSGQGPRLIQPATGKDMTAKMRRFTETFLNSLIDIDGCILKYRSPSCGIKGVKIYAGPQKGAASVPGPGFFGGAVLKKYPAAAIEDEGRLRNFRLREHFLTKLFLMADFREVRRAVAMRDLVLFQAQNKLLLMAYNQKELKILGRLVANLEKRSLAEVLKDYETHLSSALVRPPRYLSNINVLMHALGFFSKKLSAKEKAFFLDALERYRDGKIPLSVPLNLAGAWVVRFDQEYLGQQTFFDPYPEALMEITDSGKGRKM
jgi:uncharacterized protein YbgA (DUF1722 family)/uncharacterized protein YbbK (DUF523 family)